MTKKSSERPQSEPEIILPGNQPDSGIWASKTTHGTHRIYVTRLGPFGITLFAAAIGAKRVIPNGPRPCDIDTVSSVCPS